jgi:FkbM family methyltransferase
MRNLFQRVVRRVPPFPGKLRVAKVLLGNLEGPGTVIDRFGFTYEVPDLGEPIAFHLLINGVYEPETQDLLLRFLPVGGVFIDVGANIGTFTIPAAKHVGPSGQVVAIEASPDVFNVLRKNVLLNNIDNTQLTCAAAGAQNGSAEFYPAPVDHFGMGSRAPQFHSAPITIRSVTLDSEVERLKLPSVNLIKIDAEGFELDVFKGATELLNRQKPPLIVFEFCDWAEERIGRERVGAAQAYLLDQGCSIWRIHDYDKGKPITRPVTTGADMLVARKQSPELAIKGREL